MQTTIIKKSEWVKTATDIINLKITKVPTLVQPIIQRYGAISLAGSSDLGKSFLLLQLSDSVINGDALFLGMPLTTKHKSVIYVATEDDEYSLCPRLTNLSEGRGDKSAYDNLRIIFETQNLLSRLDELLVKKKADLVIIDTFGDIYDGDLNQSNKVRPFIQKFKALARKYETLFIFNHHCGKKNDQRVPHKDNLLGSQGFESSMRTVIELRRDLNDPKKRHLCIVKANNLPEDLKNASFELLFSFEKGFSSTGKRVSFEMLVKEESRSSIAKEALKGKVLALHASGLSYAKIAKKLTDEGLPIGKSTVGIICKVNRPAVQKPKEDELDGQRVEARAKSAA